MEDRVLHWLPQGPWAFVIHFTSERQFVQLLHEGRPVVVAFTIKCAYTRYLDRVLEEAAAEFYPHVKFVQVECPKYPGFCLTRQKKEYPFIEIFHSPEQISFVLCNVKFFNPLSSMLHVDYYSQDYRSECSCHFDIAGLFLLTMEAIF